MDAFRLIGALAFMVLCDATAHGAGLQLVLEVVSYESKGLIDFSRVPKDAEVLVSLRASVTPGKKTTAQTRRGNQVLQLDAEIEPPINGGFFSEITGTLRGKNENGETLHSVRTAFTLHVGERLVLGGGATNGRAQMFAVSLIHEPAAASSAGPVPVRYNELPVCRSWTSAASPSRWRGRRLSRVLRKSNNTPTCRTRSRPAGVATL